MTVPAVRTIPVLALAAALGLVAPVPATPAAALPVVPCLVTTAPAGPDGWPVAGRPVPVRCDVSLDGTANPPSYRLARLRALRWVSRGPRAAIAVGAGLPNHSPFNPYRVRVVVRRPATRGCARPWFSEIIITTRDGRAAGLLPEPTTCRRT